MITSIGVHVHYVSDQEVARDFFVDKLGFTPHTDAEMSPGRRWIEVATPAGDRINLFPVQDGFEHFLGKSSTFTLLCDDAQKTYDELKAAGVPVEGPFKEPWSTWVKVTDPDGNDFVIGEVSQQNN
ncbi:VOC family protein [Fodinicola feengrottensis]|uniref:Glyoxalase superfamily protein n=1 Tax=Fodinicola feengrottensis TaxID=435914 RepID=A0ABN2HWB8_9ACTN|nr:VOC family protein [Fodinicola feengrottensis]